MTCTIYYYNKSRQLIKTIDTSEAHLLTEDHNARLIRTRNEYMIVLKPYKDVSFIEVFCKNVFIARHFVREGILSPFISYEEDRLLCPFIKERQITTKPMYDMKRIISDRLSNPIKSQSELLTNPYGFLMKYKL